MIVGSEQYVARLDFLSLRRVSIGDQFFRYEVRALGVIITPTLDWTPQVNQSIKRMHFALRKLRFYRHSLNFQLRKNLWKPWCFLISTMLVLRTLHLIRP